MSLTVHVVAALIVDDAGRALMVRKTGTSVFMQPGGKPEPGESSAEALCRELHEELGLVVRARDLERVGRFESDAANEPGHRVVAEVFCVRRPITEVVCAAEIDEARWIGPDDVDAQPIAPLSQQWLLPIVFGARNSAAENAGERIDGVVDLLTADDQRGSNP